MGILKRKKVENVESVTESVDVGAGQPPVPPPSAPSDLGASVAPEVEALVKEVSERFGGLYGAAVSPNTILLAEQSTLFVAVLDELRRLNDNIGLLLVEVRKS